MATMALTPILRPWLVAGKSSGRVQCDVVQGNATLELIDVLRSALPGRDVELDKARTGLRRPSPSEPSLTKGSRNTPYSLVPAGLMAKPSKPRLSWRPLVTVGLPST